MCQLIVEARKLEHQYPHALQVEYRDPSTNPPKPMFQLSIQLEFRMLGRWISIFSMYGSFRKFGVPYLGVLIIGSYYLGCYTRVPYFRKPPIYRYVVRT